MLHPIRRRLYRCQPSRWHTTSAKRPRRGRLFSDRDHHVHLGGAIPPSFITDWIRAGRIALEDEIPDLVAASSSAQGGSGSLPTITVRRALEAYRGIDASKLNANGPETFLSAYNDPAYACLPSFLTMYRAYSRRELLYEDASRIARGGLVHPAADVRMSVPHPHEGSDESPSSFARREMEEMGYYRACLLPEQRLFVLFPRQAFNIHTNRAYFDAFVELLQSTIKEPSGTNAPWDAQELAFDFAGQPLPLTQTLPLLEKLRCAFPAAFICYHHGEVCPHIPFPDRIRDASLLLPYVDRMGHGLCLGLAVLGINPDACDAASDDTILQRNREVAYECLDQMATSGIGIEVSPTCNVTLGGAQSEEILRGYVREFLRVGVDVYVGTDDPGFLGTTLEKEAAILKGVDDEE